MADTNSDNKSKVASGLTPERKAQLRRDVLSELDSSNKKTTAKKTIVKAKKKTVSTKPVKSVSKAKPTQKAKPIKKLVKLKSTVKIKPMAKQPRKKSVKKATADNIVVSRPMEQRQLPGPGMCAGDSHPIKHTILFIIFLIFLGLYFIAVNIIGMYNWNTVNSSTLWIAKVFDLPAGSINGREIKMADFLAEELFLRQALLSEREGAEIFSYDDPLASTKDKIFIRLAVYQLMEEQLEKYGESVSDEEVKAQLSSVVSQFNSANEARKAIKDTYDMSLENFSEMIVRPNLAKKKLQTQIIKDKELEVNQIAVEKAEQVLRLAKNPANSFSALAAKYSDDESTLNIGGDLGWLREDKADPDLFNALVNLDEGDVFGGLLESGAGYHIFKLEKVSVNPDDGLRSVKASHILIKVDINEYLRQLMNEAVLKTYLK